VVLFPGDEVVIQCAGLPIALQELEVDDEDGGEHGVPPQLRPQLVRSTPALYLASLSTYDRKQVDIDSKIACNHSDQRISRKERRVSTTAFNSRRFLASIGLDAVF
jgi:hypothetical protein